MRSALLTISKAAIARLRAYKPPPFPLWDQLPVSRRAAVLMLLYGDRQGNLRVVITMRAASLRSFSGALWIPSGSKYSAAYGSHRTCRSTGREGRQLGGNAV